MKTHTPSTGRRMIASAKNTLDWVNGQAHRCVVHIPDEIDVARIRNRVGMSQSEFAKQYGISFRTVQQWRAIFPVGRPAPIFWSLIVNQTRSGGRS